MTLLNKRMITTAAAAAAAAALAGLTMAMALTGAKAAHAQEREPEMTASGIVVQGVGEVRVTPDIARLTLGVQTQAADSTSAAQANAALTTRVIAAIRATGVAEKDIQTSNYSIYPQYDNRPPPLEPQVNRPPVIVGYQVNNSVSVTVRRVADVGRVIDAAVKAGANVAGGIQFDLDEPGATRAREEALRLAVAAATRKAQVIADAAKVTGMQLAAIIEGGVNIPRPMYEMAQMRTSAAGGGTPVQAGEQTVTATVTVRYRMGQTASAVR